jgi:hypothetical protein
MMTAMPDERIVYGCVGADRPGALPFIDEVDGVLYYTCPACRLALAECDSRDPGSKAGLPR